jgi:glucose/arabinose dehydrogenase
MLEMSDAQIQALSVPAWKKTILAALAHYGGYVGDTGGPGFAIQFESPLTYTALGLADLLVTFAVANSLPLWEGEYVFQMASGVEWAKYLRVLVPPTRVPAPRPRPATITEFDPGLTNTGRPDHIAAGPDGNLWFTGHNNASVDRMTPEGALTEFFVRPGSNPSGITAGPDGNVWFTEPAANRVGRITPGGVVSEFSTPGSEPVDITAGPDRALVRRPAPQPRGLPLAAS